MKTYRIRYKGTKPGCEPIVADRQGSSPVMALNFLHKELQIARGFKPTDYEIVSLHLLYNSDPWGRAGYPMMESGFDLPKTPNPNLNYKETPPPQTSTMPFYDEAASTEPDSGI